MGLIFQYTQFSVIELVVTDRRNLSGTQPKSACGKSSSCWFSFSAEGNAITKATEYVTFGFSFRILVFLSFLGKFDRHCLKVIRILRIFSGHNPTNDLELITVKALPFIHQPDRVARKASDARAADWRYQTHVKKYRIFSRVFTALFRAGNHFITPQFIFKLSREWNIQSKRKKIVFFFMVLCSCFLCHYVELTRFTFSEPEPWRSDGQTSECYHVESTRLCVLGPKTGHETMVTLFNLPPSFSFTPFVQILKSCQSLKHFFFRAY